MFGLTAYLLLCAAAVAGLLARRSDPGRPIRLALVGSYLVYGLVESRAVGFGNPYSILFLWVALDATRRALVPPHARPRRPDPATPTAPTA